MRGAVQAFEAGTGVRQADARVQARACVPVEADAVVAHFDPEPLVTDAGGDLDQSAAAARRHAVLDRVLDERLQNQPWALRRRASPNRSRT